MILTRVAPATTLLILGLLQPHSVYGKEPEQDPQLTVSIAARCAEEMLAEERSDLVAERNAWAAKCGYIDQEEADFMSRKMKYVVLTAPAPFDRNAACQPQLAFVGQCLAKGCFAADQPVSFAGRYLPISLAAELDMGEVDSLAYWPTAADLPQRSPQKVEFFAKGPTQKDLLEICTQNHSCVRVTDNHRMVESSGAVISADSVIEGSTWLMTETGVSLVVSVHAIAYIGDVWNVQPVSEDSLANINFAGGILTGSLRFQNEWADEDSRLMLRSSPGA